MFDFVNCPQDKNLWAFFVLNTIKILLECKILRTFALEIYIIKHLF